ncbi:MAG: hypothetical protein CME26_14920 [Gemmatimonadetes bacterium]|nr:hypothetical protein [Gemmatimonadota bacterium]|tara:strand:- start:14654 stop:15283 length:630 start_codon:yes stop_codon:yes gene_type:complete
MLEFDGKQVCETFDEVVDRAILSVIDIENSPMWSEGNDRVILDNVKTLTGVAHSIGVPVFYFYNHRGPGFRNISAAYIRVLINLGHDPEQFATKFAPDSDRMRVHPELEPGPDDIVIGKDRGNAFEGTDLELMLRTMQRETIVLVGCSTDWCVEATAWAGTNKDYYVVVVEDCVPSPRSDGHEAALRQFRALGLDVVTSDVLKNTWEGS